MRPSRCAATVALLAILVTGPLRAEEQARVLVLGEQQGTVATRTKIELESLGCRVIFPAPRRGATREDVAREFGARAIVEIDVDGAVHVWILDPGAASARSVDVLRASSEDVTALRSVEIVRAALEQRSVPPPAPPPPAAEREPFPRFVTGFGGSVLFQPGNTMGTAGSLLADARYRLGPHFALGAFVSIPVLMSVWKDSLIAAWMIGFGALHTLETKERRWALHLGYGVGGAMLNQGGDDSVASAVAWSLIPYAKVALGLRVSSSISVTLQGLAGYSYSGHKFESHDGDAAWGEPLIMPSTTVEIEF